MSAPTVPLDDMQALFVTAFSDLPSAEYLLLAVKNPAQARQWLGRVMSDGLVASARQVQPPVAERRREVASVALSYAGLLALQAWPSVPFPSVFSDGMGRSERARGMGDAEAARWRWSDAAPPAGSDRPVAHLLVARYWATGEVAVNGGNGPFSAAAIDAAFTVVAQVFGNPGFFREKGLAFEPFGFADGIAQPEIIGLNERAERAFRDADPARRAKLARNRVAAGEFVLGLPNEYQETAHAPNLDGWPDALLPFAHGASFLAVRQIRQDMATWQAFIQAQPAVAGDEPSVAEKMVGRRYDGRPLCLQAPEESDDFGYAVADPQGFGCPRGAHMRRANPRDTQGQTVAQGEANAKLHRLLRRGRSYCAVHKLGAETGMMFIALNADIDRQFALIQQRWIAGSRFGDLGHETDPILGQTHRAFTIQDPVQGRRLTNLPRFTEVVGAGYFLLPTLRGLDFLAKLAPAHAGARSPCP